MASKCHTKSVYQILLESCKGFAAWATVRVKFKNFKGFWDIKQNLLHQQQWNLVRGRGPTIGSPCQISLLLVKYCWFSKPNHVKIWHFWYKFAHKSVARFWPNLARWSKQIWHGEANHSSATEWQIPPLSVQKWGHKAPNCKSCHFCTNMP